VWTAQRLLNRVIVKKYELVAHNWVASDKALWVAVEMFDHSELSKTVGATVV
jgi:hypothetical protein